MNLVVEMCDLTFKLLKVEKQTIHKEATFNFHFCKCQITEFFFSLDKT